MNCADNSISPDPYYNNATVSSNATSSLTSILSSSISSSISSSSQTTGLNSGSTRPQSPSSFGSEFATETHSPEAASIFPSASGNVHVNNGLSGALASSSTNTDNASASLPPSPTTELGSAHSIAPNITLSLIENSNVSVSGSISTDAPEYSPLAVVDHDNSSIEPSNSRTIIYGKNSSNVPDLNKTPFQQAPSSASTTIISFSNNSTKQAENPSATPEITPTPTTNHTSESYFQNQGSGGYRNGRYKRPQTGSSGYPGNSHNITTSFAYNSLYQNQNPYNTTLFPYNIYPPNPSLESRCGSSWLSEKSDSPVVPPAASPCCLNCTLFGGDVQVFVWPTPRPTPLVNTVYDELGHTL